MRDVYWCLPVASCVPEKGSSRKRPQAGDGIKDPPLRISSKMWWYKLEPCGSQVRTACLTHRMPSNAVSIDETMIRAFGRSHHTFKMPNKPIKQGYKLFAIADQGYILSWIWASRHKSLVEVKKQEDLTMTGSMVLQLGQ